MPDEIPKFTLPKTPDGNDPADWSDDPIAVELAQKAVEDASRKERLSRGEHSDADLRWFEELLELFKEYQSRTGHDLTATDTRKKAAYIEALRLAGRL